MTSAERIDQRDSSSWWGQDRVMMTVTVTMTQAPTAIMAPARIMMPAVMQALLCQQL